MRDPLAPLPSPVDDPSYWECTFAPRTTQAVYPEALAGDLRMLEDEPEFEPLRLLGRNLGDLLKLLVTQPLDNDAVLLDKLLQYGRGAGLEFAQHHDIG